MAFEVLEEERGAAGGGEIPPRFAWRDGRGGRPYMGCGGSRQMHFADAVGDFGNFQDGVDLCLDAFEFAGAVEGGDPLAEVVEGQKISLLGTNDYKQ
jgi:hypothetical protein